MIYKSLLKSTFNTRELGGFTLAHGVIKRGIMWRSDRLSEYDPDDEQTLLERHMTTLIDMRTEDEVRKSEGSRAPMQTDRALTIITVRLPRAVCRHHRLMKCLCHI